MLILQAPIKGKMRSLFFTLTSIPPPCGGTNRNVKKKPVITFAPQKPHFLAVSAGRSKDCRRRMCILQGGLSR